MDDECKVKSFHHVHLLAPRASPACLVVNAITRVGDDERFFGMICRDAIHVDSQGHPGRLIVFAELARLMLKKLVKRTKRLNRGLHISSYVRGSSH
ncbi:hypothetical protein KCU83_g398, partial [Aureobasidium melanogenum]